MNVEIWLADFIFYQKISLKEKEKGIKPSPFVVKDVITKKIPLRFILNEGLSYRRAVKKLMQKTLADLEDDKATGKKKFTIKFTKKIGEVNENINSL